MCSSRKGIVIGSFIALMVGMCVPAKAQLYSLHENKKVVETRVGFNTSSSGTACDDELIEIPYLTGSTSFPLAMSTYFSFDPCAKQYDYAFPNINYYPRWRKSYIGARVTEEQDGVEFDYTIRVEIRMTNGTSSIMEVDIPLSYSDEATVTHNAYSMVEIGDYEMLELVKIVSITDANGGTPTSFADNFEFVMRMEEDIYEYPNTVDFANTGTGNHSSSNLSSDEESGTLDYTLNWDGVTANNPGWYQLEWKYIDEEALEQYYTPNTSGNLLNASQISAAIEDVFEEGATRIILNDLSYTITNHFAHNGHLWWRVRNVRPYYDQPQNDLHETLKYYSAWHYPDELDDLGTAGIGYPIAVTPAISDELNWQYASTYSELGKRKQTVSYFDGSSRKRQSLYLLEEDQNVVIGTNQMYNYAGNEAVKTLPGPLDREGAKRFELESTLDRFAAPTGGATIIDYYDEVGSANSSNSSGGVSALDPNSTGATKYYSADNTWESGGSPDYMDDYLADADDFPYVVTGYDGEGRPIYSSQPGLNGQASIDDDGYQDETQFTIYKYSKPTAAEVDMYLGNHALDASQYTKVIVIDPNGHTTVTIKDLDDRTALSYIINPPSLLEPIDTKPDPIYILQDLIKESSDNKKFTYANPTGFELEKTFSLETNSDVLMNYSYVSERFSLCAPPSENEICYACAYDLSVELYNEKGELLVWWYSDPIEMDETDINHLKDGNCTEPISFNLSAQSVQYNSAVLTTWNNSGSELTFNLNRGVYTIKKTISVVSQEKLELLGADYIEEASANGCLDDEYSHIRTEITNEDYGCETEYNNEQPSPCDYLAQQMERDLDSDFGQFAVYPTVGDGYNIYAKLLNQTTYGDNLVTSQNSTFSGTSTFYSQFDYCTNCSSSGTECEPDAMGYGFEYRKPDAAPYCSSTGLNTHVDMSQLSSGNPILTLLPSGMVFSSTPGDAEDMADDVYNYEAGVEGPSGNPVPNGGDQPTYQNGSNSSTEFIIWSVESDENSIDMIANQLYSWSLDIGAIGTSSSFVPMRFKFYVDGVLIDYFDQNNTTYNENVAFEYYHPSNGGSSVVLTITIDLGYYVGTSWVPPHGLYKIDNVKFRTKDQSCDCEEAFGIENPTSFTPIYPYQCLYSLFDDASITYAGKNPSKLSIAAFRKALKKKKDDWLEYMVQIHPDYCNMLLCEVVYSEESVAFVEMLQGLEWDDAPSELSPWNYDLSDPEEGIYAADPLFETIQGLTTQNSGLTQTQIDALQGLDDALVTRLGLYLEAPDDMDVYQTALLLTLSAGGFFTTNGSNFDLDATTTDQFLAWIEGANTMFDDNNLRKAFWENYRSLYMNARMEATLFFNQGCIECFENLNYDEETQTYGGIYAGNEPPTWQEKYEQIKTQIEEFKEEVLEEISNTSPQVTYAYNTWVANFNSTGPQQEACSTYVYTKIMQNLPIVYNGTTPYIDADLDGIWTSGDDVAVEDMAENLKDECICEATMSASGTIYMQDPQSPFPSNLTPGISSDVQSCGTCVSDGIAAEFVNTLWNSTTYPGPTSVSFASNHSTNPEALFLLELNPYVLNVTQQAENFSTSSGGMATTIPNCPSNLNPGYNEVYNQLDGATGLTFNVGNSIEVTTSSGNKIYLFNDDLTGDVPTGPISIPTSPTMECDAEMIRNAMYQTGYGTAHHFFIIEALDGATPIELRGFFPSSPVFDKMEEYEEIVFEPTPIVDRVYCDDLVTHVAGFMNTSLMENHFTEYGSAPDDALHDIPQYLPSLRGYLDIQVGYFPEQYIFEQMNACEVYKQASVESEFPSSTIGDYVPNIDEHTLHPLCDQNNEEYDPVCEECDLFYRAMIDYELGGGNMEESQISSYLNGVNYSTLASSMNTEYGTSLTGSFSLTGWTFEYPRFHTADDWNHFYAVKLLPEAATLKQFLIDHASTYCVPDPSIPANTIVSYGGAGFLLNSLPTAVSGLNVASLEYNLAGDPSDDMHQWIYGTSTGRVWFHMDYEGSDLFHDVWLDYKINNGSYQLPDLEALMQVTGVEIELIPVYGSGDIYEFYFIVTDPATEKQIVVRGLSSFPIAEVCEMPAISLYERPSNEVASWVDNCEQEKYYRAYRRGEDLYQEYLEEALQDFIADYTDHCLDYLDESFIYGFDHSGYNYTLYLYDRSDNLIATVPPEGVRPLVKYLSGNSGQLQYHPSAKQAILNHRNDPNNGSFVDPFQSNSFITSTGAYRKHHFMITEYDYNTYNEVYKQTTPDGGTTTFHYDQVGRIAFSQNDDQLLDYEFSYTLYDEQSRIVETGELVFETTSSDFTTGPSLKLHGYELGDLTTTDLTNAGIAFLSNHSWDFDQLQLIFENMEQEDWNGMIQEFTRHHAIVTTYDEPPTFGLEDHSDGLETNLRGRVSSMYKYDELEQNLTTFDNGIVYHYDVAGNVNRLYREIQEPDFDDYKEMYYYFDQVSGNVGLFHYQPGQEDELLQAYTYDSDNRLTAAMTSREGVIWDLDATYDYYRHGPLKDMVLGDKALQHMEYVYTLNGWMKALNGITDLEPTGDYPDDVFAYEMYYNSSDYSAIDGSLYAPGGSMTENLYNGNITGITLKQRMDVDGDDYIEVGRKYRYDQLQRIKKFEEYREIDGSGWDGASKVQLAGYTYDGNGNILSLDRWGYKSGYSSSLNQMDNLGYGYNPENNQLDGYCETIAKNAFEDDIDKAASTLKYVYPIGIAETAGIQMTVCDCVDFSNWSSSISAQCSSVDPNDFFNKYIPAEEGDEYFDVDYACKIETLIIEIGGDCDPAQTWEFVVAHVPDHLYYYDAIGNLIKDEAEGIEVEWNPIGKVDNIDGEKTGQTYSVISTGGSFGTNTVVPTGYPSVDDGANAINLTGGLSDAYQTQLTTTRDLAFDYDPLGERIKKYANVREVLHYLFQNYDGGVLDYEDGVSFVTSEEAKMEYYIRDAQGNVIAMYDRKVVLSTAFEYYDAMLSNLVAYDGSVTNYYTDVAAELMDKSWPLKQNVMLAAGKSNQDVINLLDHNDVFDELPELMISLMLDNDAAYANDFFDDDPSVAKGVIRSTPEFAIWAQAEAEALAQSSGQMGVEYALFQQHSATLSSDIAAAKSTWESCLATNMCVDKQSCVPCEDGRIADPYNTTAYNNCLGQAPCSGSTCPSCSSEWTTYDDLANLLTFQTRYDAQVAQNFSDLMTGSLGLTSTYYEDGSGDLLPVILDMMSTLTFVQATAWRDFLDDEFNPIAPNGWQTDVMAQVDDEDDFVNTFFMDHAASTYYNLATGSQPNSQTQLATIMARSPGHFDYDQSNVLFARQWGLWALRWCTNDPDRAPGTSGLEFEPPYQGAVAYGGLPDTPMSYLEYVLEPAEYYIYGSKRLGTIKHYDAKVASTHKRQEGMKQYEVTDHLGNVRALISDRKLVKEGTTDLDVDLISSNDYYPFGMPMRRRFENYEPVVEVTYETIENETTYAWETCLDDEPGNNGTTNRIECDGDEIFPSTNLDDYWEGRGTSGAFLANFLSGSPYTTTTTSTGYIDMNSSGEEIHLTVKNSHLSGKDYVGVVHEISDQVYPQCMGGTNDWKVTASAWLGGRRAEDNTFYMAIVDSYGVPLASTTAETDGSWTDLDWASVTANGVTGGGTYYVVIYMEIGSGSIDAFLNIHGWWLRLRENVPTTEAVVESTTFNQQPHYRYGFNGMERDDELKNIGNSYDFGARIYDPRLGRWWSLDPKMAIYPDQSPYDFCLNNPIYYIDPDGKHPGVFAIPFVVEGIEVAIAVTATYIVAKAVTDNMIMPALEQARFTTYYSSYSPEYEHQRRRERAAQDFARAKDLAFQKMLRDNLPQNDPSGEDPDRYKKMPKYVALVLGSLELLHSMKDILVLEGQELDDQIKTKKNELEVLRSTDEGVALEERKTLLEMQIERLSVQRQANYDAQTAVDEYIAAEEADQDTMAPNIARKDNTNVVNTRIPSN